MGKVGKSNYTVSFVTGVEGGDGDKTDNYHSFAYEMVHRPHN